MRIRLKKRFTWRRTLAHGSSVVRFNAGDYEVGEDIPEEAAHAAITAKCATRIKASAIDGRETKDKQPRVA